MWLTMQAISLTGQNPVYSWPMKTGRPSKHPRPVFAKLGNVRWDPWALQIRLAGASENQGFEVRPLQAFSQAS